MDSEERERYEAIVTGDGSHTLYLPSMEETYHSTGGAIEESMHVFIDAGYSHSSAYPVTITEVGFGTGLNALLTAIRSDRDKRETLYVTIERYPLAPETALALNYPTLLKGDSASLFRSIHTAPWEEECAITPWFRIIKLRGDIREIPLRYHSDIIYFDAFAPSKQPEIWQPDILHKIAIIMKSNAIFVTYSAKGVVRRNLSSLGLEVERLPGGAGKREMLRARKAP